MHLASRQYQAHWCVPPDGRLLTAPRAGSKTDVQRSTLLQAKSLPKCNTAVAWYLCVFGPNPCWRAAKLMASARHCLLFTSTGTTTALSSTPPGGSLGWLFIFIKSCWVQQVEAQQPITMMVFIAIVVKP